MDEIFEVDATAVLCKVPKTAVTHCRRRERQRGIGRVTKLFKFRILSIQCSLLW